MKTVRGRRRNVAWLAMLAAAACSIVALQWFALWPSADDPQLLNCAKINCWLGPDWAPLYVLTLRLAYLLSGDTLTAFRMVVSAISLGSFALLVCWIRKCSGSSKFAAAAGLFYLVSGFSPLGASTHQSHLLIESSLAGHMALCFVLMSLLSTPSLRSTASLALSSAALLLATYCRPEFLLGSAICLTGSFVSIFSANVRSAARLWTVGLACLWASLIYVWGLPLPTSGRAFVAFGQHASLGFCAVYDGLCVTNLWLDWMSYMGRLFPGATSLWTALEANPLAFFEHLARNCILAVLNLFTGLFDFAGLPEKAGVKLAVAAGFALWAAFELGVAIRGKSKVVAMASAARRPDRMLLGIAIASTLPQLANWILLYPRAHYMVVPVVIGLGLLSYPLRFWQEGQPAQPKPDARLDNEIDTSEVETAG